MSDSNGKHKWYWDDARLRQLLTWITGKISGSIPNMTEFTKEEIEALWNTGPAHFLSGTVTPGTGSFSFLINEIYERGEKGTTITVTPDSDGSWYWDNDEGYEITSTYRMFHGCPELTSLDASGFNTENVTNMREMFADCSGLTDLDVSGFNTENVTDMSGMFYGCNSLTNLNLANWNTQNVTDMSAMFYGCNSLTNLNLANWNTQNVISYTGFVNNIDTLTINYKPANWKSSIPTAFPNVNWVAVA